MLKNRPHRKITIRSKTLFLIGGAVLTALLVSAFTTYQVRTVTFEAADGLEITADEYFLSEAFPYILLFHEQESSRGEFNTIARRLGRMDYNCLAVDLRNGGNSSYVSNETAKLCRERRCATGAEEIAMDMEAAIEYAYSRSGQPVILFGSCANGSLSLIKARDNDRVSAVVALSPGEYFLPSINVQDTIRNLKKPVFITSSKSEYPYVTELASDLDEAYKTLFEPELGQGGRGTRSLTDENRENSEYWLALLLFFKDLI